jgi:hypothetical protein
MVIALLLTEQSLSVKSEQAFSRKGAGDGHSPFVAHNFIQAILI